MRAHMAAKMEGEASVQRQSAPTEVAIVSIAIVSIAIVRIAVISTAIVRIAIVSTAIVLYLLLPFEVAAATTSISEALTLTTPRSTKVITEMF